MVFKIVTNEFAKLDKFDELFAIKGLLEDEALSQSGLSKAVYEYIRSLGVASVAEMTFAQKLELSIMAIKEQAAAFIASPLGMATIAAVTIFALVKAVDWFSKSVERSREKLSELKEKFDEIDW